MTRSLACFKAYDLRGRVPDVLSPEIARALGRALKMLGGSRVALGHDARLSSPMLLQNLAAGLDSWGAEIFSLGLCGTEEIYDAACRSFDLGIAITGSHNPPDENGFKIVRANAVPVSADSGLKELEAEVLHILAKGETPAAAKPPPIQKADFRKAYLRRLLDIAEMDKAGAEQRGMRVLVDAGNGCAGPVLEELAEMLPFELIPLNWKPDGSFPNGVPNPLLPEKRSLTASAARRCGADLAVAFDGDFDRCFFYSGNGAFIHAGTIGAILARQILAANPGEKIIHDTRTYWSMRETALKCGGAPIMGKCGHALIKERMRKEGAVFACETSGHYFYRDFSFCDSGMLTMILVLSFLSRSEQSLAEIAEETAARHPAAEETNFRVADAPFILERVWEKYFPHAQAADRLDGINLEFPLWRFNLRASNTENLLRLNVESRGDSNLLREKHAELEEMIGELTLKS